MATWEELYKQSKDLYNPHEVSPFVYSHHVVAAIEAENGQIFTGVCFEATAGVLHLCAERMAAVNMYMASGQTKIKKILAYRDRPPYGAGTGMPCGACREFLMQLSAANASAEIMQDYDRGETITLGELMPFWWGEDRLKMDL